MPTGSEFRLSERSLSDLKFPLLEESLTDLFSVTFFLKYLAVILGFVGFVGSVSVFEYLGASLKMLCLRILSFIVDFLAGLSVSL
jgi:hypothetical protein